MSEPIKRYQSCECGPVEGGMFVLFADHEADKQAAVAAANARIAELEAESESRRELLSLKNKEISALERTAAECSKEIDKLKAEVALHRRKALDEYWAWQNDGEDHPESLGCPVLMHQEDLRGMLARIATLESENTRLRGASTFPNPLQLTVGTGILVSHFKDNDGGRGVLFQITDREHKEGELYPKEMVQLPHKPEPGELYLKFPTAVSAVVVLEAITETIIGLMGMPERNDAALVGTAPTCHWRPDEDGVWESECGHRFELNTGTPAENGILYCHRCGNQLAIAS